MSRFFVVRALLLSLLNVLLLLPSVATAEDGRQTFFTALGKLCGARFEGATTFPLDPAHDFAGKKLVAEFKRCDADEIRISFTVGDDHSRTWLIRLDANGLSLKHDHRHEDGTPDAVTLYGGYAQAAGSALSQSFGADAYTAQLIPAAATNVWTLSLSADAQSLTYHLDRDGKPRYEAVLHRMTPVLPAAAMP